MLRMENRIEKQREEVEEKSYTYKNDLQVAEMKELTLTVH